MTPAQCRMARAGIGWGVRDLAAAAEVAMGTLVDFETGKRTPQPRTLAAIRAALEAAGVIFVEANGGGPRSKIEKMADPNLWAAALPGLITAAVGAGTSITIAFLNPWLSHRSKIKEQSWSQKQEAYSSLIVSLEACAFKALEASIHENNNTPDIPKITGEMLDLYRQHHDVYKTRRFLVSRRFASRHSEMIAGFLDVTNKRPMAAAIRKYLSASNRGHDTYCGRGA